MFKIFLRKIRLNGFKSFAKKTDIEIEENITAIVGPNGSGKSNIVDAIRWVLGEQSAKALRGSRMSDIIFSGSDEKKASHQASVTLFFDNSEGILSLDGDEVTISRKVDAEGRSDYLINGAACRLKDIEMLLMDTGLGSDGYSIIGQGKIDSIIHSKPDKMRLFFEEAAGIMKHKKRKEEAEKRLKNTSHDLNRVKDLIDELEKRREPLKKASQKAKRYFSLKEDLSELEISLLNKRWINISEDYLEIKNNRDKAEAVLNKQKNIYEKISNFLKEKKEKLKLLKNRKDSTTDEYFQTENKLNEIKNTLNILVERRKNYLQEKKILQNKIDDLNKDASAAEKIYEDSSKNFKIISLDEKSLQDKLEKFKEELSLEKEKINNLDKKIAKNKNLITRLKEEKNQLKSRNDRLNERLDINGERLDEINNSRKELISELETQMHKFNSLEDQIKKINQEIELAENKIESSKKEINNYREQLEEQKEKLEAAKEEFQRLGSRLQLMEEMQESYEGYYYGVKNVLEKKEDFPGIIDVVAEILDVEKKYETAVETALGAKLQNIVVEDDGTAKKAVSFLKKTGSGRATFLPLNMIDGSRISDYYLDKLNNTEGFIAAAVDLVQFSEKFIDIFNFLLGRIIVTDNIDSAVKAARIVDKNFKIVTLDGDVVFPGGAISGGSSKNSKRNLLGRNRVIEELSEEKEKLRKKGKKQVDKAKNLNEKLKKSEQILENQKEEFQKKKLEKNSLISTKESFSVNIDNLKNRISKINNDYADLFSSSSENKVLFKKNKEKIIEFKEKIADLESELVNLTEKKSSKKENISELEDIIGKLQVDGARITEKKQNAKKRLNEKKENLQKINNIIDENLQRICDLDENLNKIEKREKSLHSTQNKLMEKRDKLAVKKSELEDRIKNLETVVEKKEKKLEYIQKQLTEIRDEFHDYDIIYNKLLNKLENIEQILREDYQLNPGKIDSSLLTNIPDSEEDKIEKEIENYKKEIKKLHPVNEAAVEEFAELKERLDFLHEQQEDLISARKTIEIVISDIEQSMYNMFSKTFSAVKVQFEKVFKALFQGGEAELKLTDPDDLLNSGVEIHAQPPGKSLKSLSLLSGGERALTAIALIFAFVQVKPSPFYVLDEIDAPLDDVNIVRFASFIRKFSKVAQFIIITHRRYMMTEVDTLYGVTMEKSGVSRLISLKLDHKDQISNNFVKEAIEN
ncbi:condensin subunit Smc [Halanaerobium sp. DL-01]|uniref:chromosome segregation protein SMC n=1 Tax=Halanaerobium sp. DL-01 TaxID=1653064 RepID=UPI000DF31DA2|nr:chromosome segregation protein SMC [Halanaerobium sp. DL-01]RCW82155.1 condensin subunit Smc [Halanaerobium sp. DL-01]